MRQHRIDRRIFRASEEDMTNEDIEFLERQAKSEGWELIGWRPVDGLREFILEREVERGSYRRIPKGWKRPT